VIFASGRVLPFDLDDFGDFGAWFCGSEADFGLSKLHFLQSDSEIR
jgi:hypothetical protein